MLKRSYLEPLTEPLDLASERAGGCVLAASDDFFAEKENLIKDEAPVFVPGKYTDRGKWMDGWESRRKRTPGHDWAILRLGIPGVIQQVIVDTSYFTGNYPEQASIEGCEVFEKSQVDELTEWTELLPKSPLAGDAKSSFAITSPRRCTHLRFNIFPDGGVARLRVHGIALPDWRSAGEVDLAAAAWGGAIVDASDRHYGHPQNLILPGQARDMRDGWETRRRRGPGHDWVILRLAAEGIIERVEVDTAYFKGNYPDSCSLDISAAGTDGPWLEALAQVKLEADARHVFPELRAGPARFARFRIFPDGGVSRLRLFGRLTEAGRLEAVLASLNAASNAAARGELMRCCGSASWAAQLAAARPFRTLADLDREADRIWAACGREDWLEAFAAHPRIGQRSGGNWSREEQSGTGDADPAVQQALAAANREYEAKFGHQFIVCATGKTAAEMLALLGQRLHNDPQIEIGVAAEQQRLITGLRLRRLLSE